LLAFAVGGIAPAYAGSSPLAGGLHGGAHSQAVATHDSAVASTPDALKTASPDNERWTAKDVVIVVAAVGFVLLLVVGAVVVKRRGES
jgi:hypothetical protein